MQDFCVQQFEHLSTISCAYGYMTLFCCCFFAETFGHLSLNIIKIHYNSIHWSIFLDNMTN